MPSKSSTAIILKIPSRLVCWPQFGSLVAKVLGPAQPSTPPYVSMCYQCSHGPYNEPGPGFLGASNDSFRPLGPTKHDMVLNGITMDRLGTEYHYCDISIK